MNSYITGSIIKHIRENKKMTQAELAEKLNVSDKAVSKWETAKGYPDITLVEQLSSALGVSVVELFSGCEVVNKNQGFNMKRSLFYVCPVCGNVTVSAGEALVCCYGITLPPAEPELPDEMHRVNVEEVEDEYYVTVSHEMSKEHYISFIAAVTDDSVTVKKLYPEGNSDSRFKKNRTYAIYYYCNRHGLFRAKTDKH